MSCSWHYSDEERSRYILSVSCLLIFWPLSLYVKINTAGWQLYDLSDHDMKLTVTMQFRFLCPHCLYLQRLHTWYWAVFPHMIIFKWYTYKSCYLKFLETQDTKYVSKERKYIIEIYFLVKWFCNMCEMPGETQKMLGNFADQQID